MMSTNRLQVHVLRSHDRGWVVEYEGMWLNCYAQTPGLAVKAARKILMWHILGGGLVQIMIHNAAGDFVRDVTLPRKSDPRRSKG